MQPLYAAGGDLRLREFEDGALVFDPVSWNAHLLNPAAAAVLTLCIEAAVSEAEVRDFLYEALNSDQRGDASVHAARLLRELGELGLVSPALPPCS